MNKLLPIGAVLLAGIHSAQSSTFILDADLLRTFDGLAMPTSGLVILTAATEGVFSGPIQGAFTSGSEIIVKKWDLSEGFATAGVFQATATNLIYSGAWTSGDALRLYWYPTLTIDSSQPSYGDTYGTYTDATGIDGSAPWFTPGASDTISLKFFTTAAVMANPGSNPASAGNASLQVVPEPATFTLGILSIGILGFVRRRRML